MSTVNEGLRARANALFAQNETLKSSELALKARIATNRLQLILDGVVAGTMTEWENIFGAFGQSPFQESFGMSPPPGVSAQDWNEVYGQFLEPCGVKHRHMNLTCVDRPGHPGSHHGGGFEWDNPDCGPSLHARLALLEDQHRALRQSFDAFKNHRHEFTANCQTKPPKE